MSDEMKCPLCDAPMEKAGRPDTYFCTRSLYSPNDCVIHFSLHKSEIEAMHAKISAARRKGFEMARDKIADRAYAWGLDALTAEIRAMKMDGEQ